MMIEKELRAYGYGTLASASCYILNYYMLRSYPRRRPNESLDAIKKLKLTGTRYLGMCDTSQ